MDKVRLFFAGDFCSKPTTSYITASDELKELIQSCDLRVVNFEVPLKPDVTLPPQQYPRFWQNDDAPDFLREDLVPRERRRGLHNVRIHDFAL